VVDQASGKLVAEATGNSRDPLTWGRWEEEYFYSPKQADLGVAKDPHKGLRPAPVVDQVPARELWRSLQLMVRSGLGDPDMLEDYDRGLNRMLPPMVGKPGWLRCDEPIDLPDGTKGFGAGY
jgi:hypothetical protein